MQMKHVADVLVVGGGTAGSYFAWKMAERGYSVIVLEKRMLEELGTGIEIFHMEKIRFEEFDIPHPTPPELIHTEDIGYTYSPDLQVKVPVRGTFYVMHMPLFIQRLHAYARKAGASFIEHASVEELIIEDGALVGIRGKQDGERFEARGSLVIDASGLAAAVRTRLPESFGIENDPVPPDDCLYVCLELRSEIPEGYPTGSNGYMFYKAFWNKSYGDDVVLGIGQPISFGYAWQKHKEWREAYFGDPGVVVARRQGAIPFTRTPFSFVGNGLMIVGDAANQNKPFSGEGVTSGFTAVAIAVDVADKALKNGSTHSKALWDYNLRYHRGQGAKFAGSFAQLPATVELSQKDVDYLFHKGIIFTSEDFETLNRDYEIQFNTHKLIKIALTLVWGVLTGQFSAASLQTFMKASSQAGKIKKHYINFPTDPAKFDSWAQDAKQLWREV